MERYKAIFGCFPDIVILTDVLGTIIDINRAPQGYRKEDFIGTDFKDFHNNDQMILFEKAVEETIQSNRPSSYEVSITNPKGTVLHWNNLISVLKTKGTPTMLIINCRVITEQKKVEEPFVLSEDIYKNLINNASDAIVTIDTKGFITSCNPSALRIFNFSKDDLVGKHFSKAGILHSKDIPKYLKVFASIIRGKSAKSFELSVKGKDGSLHIVETRIDIIKENHKIQGLLAITRDITDQKRTEQKLIESESRLLESQQIAKLGSWEWNIENNILWWSDELYHIFGVVKDEFKLDYNTIEKSIHPDDRERTRRYVDLLLKDECVEPIEIRIITPDGSIKWIHQKVDTIKNKSGTIIMSKGIIQDITKRKQAEEALKESEMNYSDIFNSVNDAIVIHDSETGAVLDVNRAMCEMWGFTRNEALKTTTDNLSQGYPPYSQEEGKRKATETIQKGTTTFEWLCKRKNGETFWADVTLNRVKIGGKDRLLAITRNITERKQAEERLRFLGAISENMYDSIIATDDEFHINYINKRAQELLGYTLDELQGKTPEMLYAEPMTTAIQRELNETVASGRTYSTVLLTRRKDGSTFICDYRIMPLVNNEGRTVSYIGIQRDITKQKIADEEIKESHRIVSSMNNELKRQVAERTKEIERLLKQKDEFINQLGHDLKNPLGPFVSLLPVLQKKEHDPKKKEILNVLHRNVGYMTNLVKKTIALAQLNSSNTSFDFEQTNLLEEILRILETNNMAFKERHIQVHTNVPKEIYVPADKLRLEELFTNLINNAVKYAKDGGGTITIDAIENNNDVTISIKDNGIGMTSDQIKHIFDEFFKADPARHDLDSSGLGLPICKRIVEKHGGMIWAESKGLGKGSTIYFILPK
jgi:PAS domain S-box-containing protein